MYYSHPETKTLQSTSVTDSLRFKFLNRGYKVIHYQDHLYHCIFIPCHSLPCNECCNSSKHSAYYASNFAYARVSAKSLQLCPTLCNSMDCSPPGSSVHGILQTGMLEWVPWLPPGDLPDPVIKHTSLMSLALAPVFFTTGTNWETLGCLYVVSLVFLFSLDKYSGVELQNHV